MRCLSLAEPGSDCKRAAWAGVPGRRIPVRPNTIKEQLRNGGTSVGCFVPFPSPSTVEICGLVGFDFVMIDCEHGPASPESAYNMVLAAEAAGTVPLLRVPVNTPQVILRYMDIGTAGVMAPQVNSADEARAVVDAVKYHPGGHRGIAGVRAAGWGIPYDLPAYAEKANQETMVLVQFENIRAFDQVPDILKVPGIDVLFVGPNDLAHSMGYPGQPGHPEVQKVIDDVIAVAKDSGVWLGTVAPNAEAANGLIERGFRMIGANSAALLAAASKQMLADVKR
jgi:4-hydroxy-2-oxoheptanedioate aldolase